MSTIVKQYMVERRSNYDYDRQETLEAAVEQAKKNAASGGTYDIMKMVGTAEAPTTNVVYTAV